LKAKLVVYSNITLYFLITLLLVRAVLQPTNVKEAGLYAVTAVVISLINVAVIIALVIAKPWARVAAIAWSLSCAFLIIALQVILYVRTVVMLGELPETSLYFDFNTVVRLVLGIALVTLAVLLGRATSKEYFTSHR